MKLWDNTPGLCLTEPEIIPYVPAQKCSDAAIVIFPGGGYHGLADHEGAGYAEFLAGKGIAVRSGLHCAPLAHESAGTLETGTVRVSVGFDTFPGQIAEFLRAASKMPGFTE